MQTERIYNFNAGPATLPLTVLQQAREDILNYKDCGCGVMEISHRSGLFEDILESTKANLKELLNIPDNYSIIFTTGGASNQFSMVPLNLLEGNRVGNYILSGTWSQKALKEAGKFGKVHVASSSEDSHFRHIPSGHNISQNAAYLHFTSNNTIVGTQFKSEPKVTEDIDLICDASSDLLHKPLDVSRYALIYAGAQKNLGPAGVTLVIIRNDLLEKSRGKTAELPVMLSFNTYADSNSLYNTPPTFPIYALSQVLKWLKSIGGLKEVFAKNQQKAELLYNYLDSSSFFTTEISKDSRSLMNVVFHLSDKSLEDKFIQQAEQQKLCGLKGHRSVGGLRASIYNAFPLEGVEALVDFMRHFESKHS